MESSIPFSHSCSCSTSNFIKLGADHFFPCYVQPHTHCIYEPNGASAVCLLGAFVTLSVITYETELSILAVLDHCISELYQNSWCHLCTLTFLLNEHCRSAVHCNRKAFAISHDYVLEKIVSNISIGFALLSTTNHTHMCIAMVTPRSKPIKVSVCCYCFLAEFKSNYIICSCYKPLTIRRVTL